MGLNSERPGTNTRRRRPHSFRDSAVTTSSVATSAARMLDRVTDAGRDDMDIAVEIKDPTLGVLALLEKWGAEEAALRDGW